MLRLITLSLLSLTLVLPLSTEAATKKKTKKKLAKAATIVPAAAAVTVATTAAATTSAESTSANNLAEKAPTFISQLEASTHNNLSATDVVAVTQILTQSGGLLTLIKDKFFSALGSITGLDPAVLGVLIPSVTQNIPTSELTSRLESKLGAPLNFIQTQGVSAANSIRNNSLDSVKEKVSESVAQKTGVSNDIVKTLLPSLGFSQ